MIAFASPRQPNAVRWLSKVIMSAPSSHQVTQLLVAWSEGDQGALDKLVPLIEAELRRLAKQYLKRERAGHVLQTSALVNEAYVRLIDWRNAKWQNRAHFFGVSAQLMRRILVDFARRRPRNEGGEVRHVPLDDALMLSRGRSADLVALDEALNALAEVDPRKGRIVELRFFGGLSVEETAEVLGISGITVMREWNKARAWLYRELARGGVKSEHRPAR
ncbi:MAG TPA: sigma-70 family RNA polymerase sigma factor [Blastocatellia bacterium]|nr:sigma-70 family RNA polymerase sigma factor [Blastocatellia bacterium]